MGVSNVEPINYVTKNQDKALINAMIIEDNNKRIDAMVIYQDEPRVDAANIHQKKELIDDTYPTDFYYK